MIVRVVVRKGLESLAQTLSIPPKPSLAKGGPQGLCPLDTQNFFGGMRGLGALCEDRFVVGALGPPVRFANALLGTRSNSRGVSSSRLLELRVLFAPQMREVLLFAPQMR